MWAWWANITWSGCCGAAGGGVRWPPSSGTADPIVDEKTLVIVISQSGETLDTMAALREAKRRGARILSIVNVVGSSIARESDDVLYTWAGPEIAVATTKAYSTQMAVLDLLGLYLGEICWAPWSYEDIHRHGPEMILALPEKLEQVLAQERMQYSAASPGISTDDSVFFIGRNLDYALGMEGSSEAQGDQLYPLRGLRLRRAEARHHLPDRGGDPGHGPGHLRPAV